MSENNILLPLFLSATVIISAFAGMMTVFLIVHKRKQTKNKLEKQKMEFHYNSAILNTKIEVQEQALQMVSQEIHDNVGQVLSFTRMQLATLKKHIFTEEGSNILGENLILLRKSIKDLRLLSHSLNTGLIETRELEDAISTELERIEVFSEMHCKLTSEGHKIDVPPSCRLLIFRIVQEALHNVTKHSEANNIAVAVIYTPHSLSLEIYDDGIGFDTKEKIGSAYSLGMASMKQRATMLEGELQIFSEPNFGAKIVLTLPTTFATCQQVPKVQFA